MKTNHIEKFIMLQSEIEKNIKILTPTELYFGLINWADGLKDSHQSRDRNLYLTYLSYFEKLNIEDYIVDPLWYDFNELINYGLLKHRPLKLEGTVVVVRDILWEIIAFKSNKNCNSLGEDDLRALTDKNRQITIFCCDGCGYTENIEGDEVKIKEILYPATRTQILDLGILPPKIY